MAFHGVRFVVGDDGGEKIKEGASVFSLSFFFIFYFSCFFSYFFSSPFF
jgi:hypothetical protein